MKEGSKCKIKKIFNGLELLNFRLHFTKRYSPSKRAKENIGRKVNLQVDDGQKV